jgi:hypothetical protein
MLAHSSMIEWPGSADCAVAGSVPAETDIAALKIKMACPHCE